MFRSFKPAASWLALTLTMLGGSVASAATPPSFEITPFAGYRAGGQFLDGSTTDKLDLRGAAGGALAFNWRAAEQGAQYELLYSRQSTETDSATPVDMNIEYLHIGGTTVIGELGARVEPFAAGGIGATRLSPDATGLSRETRWSFNLGGGVRVPVASHVRLRLEARGYLTWLGNQAELFCAGGCTLTAKSRTFFQYEALAGVSIGF